MVNWKNNISATILIFLGLLSLSYQSCTHDPILVKDTGEPMDTMTMDTTIGPGDTTTMDNPCLDDVIYFEKQILPILKSNCAFSGCHDAASANDGVILESYNSVITTADVQPFNLGDSEMYEVLVEDNPNKRMPPPPTASLSSEQINIISQWILQGAKNLKCDEPSECSTENIKFSVDVLPVINNHCKGCHNGASASGGINLDGYANIKIQVDNGNLIGAITWLSGYQRMPQGQDQLDACTLNKIKKWVDDGAQDN
jgi:hypothetical protein